MTKIRSIATALAAFATLCLVGGDWAGAGYDEGMDAFAEGDYATAYEELRPLAERGEPGAQFTLGFMYDYGQGVQQNTQEAIWWYRNAAEEGIAVAQFSLGEIYEGGRGTPKDLAEAYRWYSLAAENLSPGEIRDSVIERRDAIAGKLSREQIATVTALLNGAARTPSKDSAPREAADAAPSVGDAALVAAIQGELARLGYELNWQLGSLDKLTRGAIQAFEIESGRAITGQASDALLEALRATERPGPALQSRVAAKDSGATTRHDAMPGADAAAGKVEAAAAESIVAALDEPAAAAGEAPLAEGTLDWPSGAAGGPLIPLDDQATAARHQETRQEQAALPEAAPPHEAVASDAAAREPTPGAAGGGGWDLKFIERQIKRLDAITARVDGPSAAMPGWDALEAWEIETRGLLAARLGQDAASGLTMARQTPVVGDPYGNFHHTSAAYRTYLSVLLDEL